MSYPEKIKELLISERVQLEGQILELRKRIEDINALVGESEIAIDWNAKISSYLNAYERPFTTDELLKYIFTGYNNILEDKGKRKSYVKQASLMLFRLCERNVLFAEEVKGYKGKIYGLVTWKEKPEYQYYFEQKKSTLIREKNRFFAELH